MCVDENRFYKISFTASMAIDAFSMNLKHERVNESIESSKNGGNTTPTTTYTLDESMLRDEGRRLAYLSAFPYEVVTKTQAIK